MKSVFDDLVLNNAMKINGGETLNDRRNASKKCFESHLKYAKIIEF